MAHKHPVYDTDKHFSIDPVTRKITNECGKLNLQQYDHDSERFTFEIPKEVDGHDMSKCNVVQIHYLNIEAANKSNKYAGIYEVYDLQTGTDDTADIVFGSWLISDNATQFVGSLNFVVRFACVADDGTIEYAWNTAIHSTITIGEGINNSGAVVTEYADVLEQWRQELIDSGGVSDDRIEAAVEAYMAENPIKVPESSGGLDSTASALLITILRNGVFSSDQSANITALEAALASSGSDDNEDGDSGDDTHTHSYTSSVTTEPTCTTVGVRTYTCSCGDTYTESIAATGHNYVDGVCSVCGAADPDAETERNAKYGLPNGTYTLDNGSILTITKGYHVSIDQKGTGVYEILDVNNTGEVAFTIPAGSNAILSVSNKTSSANPNEVFMNMVNVLPMGVQLGGSATLDTTNAIEVRTLKPRALTSGVVAEYDVSLTVDGEVWI